jgi:hypothetical protein
MDNTQPEMSIDILGTKVWYLRGYFHRTDGPAIEHVNGDKQWCLHGANHRDDGPAIERANGTVHWYLNGRFLSFDDWLMQTTGLTDEEKVMMKLQYG